MKKATLILLVYIAMATYAISQPCLPEGITFTTQQQIDNFQNDYPGCSIIEGSVHIEGSDIVSLHGLVFLEAIGGDLVIGGPEISGTALEDFYGLYYLESIGGSLFIENNPFLASLTGMDNLDGESFESLSICNNPMLSLCDVYSLCNYLNLPTVQATICNNGPGCNSITEVQSECENNCGHGEIFFGSQASINNFQDDYPDCEEIYGYVTIDGNDISSLEGLSPIKTLHKRLLIGELYPTSSNPNLLSLQGLENLTYVGGWIGVNWNESLVDCSGLDNLVTVGAKLQFKGNPNLYSLNGLGNLKTVGGSLEIEQNDELVDISDLDSLLYVGGSLYDDGLKIANNYSLSACAFDNLCRFINDTNTNVSIFNNAPGCNSTQEVRVICRTCFEEGVVFNTQAQVDSFAMNYPDCEYIAGDLVIEGGGNIVNLEGLQVISSVGGMLLISENQNLNNLSGLNNISSVGGSLMVQQNQNLNTLSGLDNISSVGGSLLVEQHQNLNSLSGLNGIASIGGSLKIIENPLLDSLTFLSNLNAVNDTLWLEDNAILSSLVGLHNLTPYELNFLHLTDNPSLHYCEVESICEYLMYSFGDDEIYNNAPGCNSLDEVYEACWIKVDENQKPDLYAFYPVPADDVLIFSTQLDHFQLSILDIRGQVVSDQMLVAGESLIDVSSLLPGIYILEIIQDQSVFRERLVIR